MFNPFPPYESKYLDMFRKKGVVCFLKQTFDRGKNLLEEQPRPAFLLTHYEDRGLALEHLDSLKHDKAAEILMLNNPRDYTELVAMGEPSGDVLAYMRFRVKNIDEKAKRFLDKKIRFYIDHVLHWRVSVSSGIQLNLDFIFGDIYIELRQGDRYHKVKIEEIEKMKAHVL